LKFEENRHDPLQLPLFLEIEWGAHDSHNAIGWHQPDGSICSRDNLIVFFLFPSFPANFFICHSSTTALFSYSHLLFRLSACRLIVHRAEDTIFYPFFILFFAALV
jgi:hypothetical protein